MYKLNLYYQLSCNNIEKAYLRLGGQLLVFSINAKVNDNTNFMSPIIRGWLFFNQEIKLARAVPYNIVLQVKSGVGRGAERESVIELSELLVVGYFN
ncbi:hypothetical protein [Providencia rettgeri]|uniref:hypothetical protein n=1 Tax=Providencia rettgeri TaxID=587 RepID=UPI0018C61548|nr:hypothetical protein [Providencia rettgeri]MBG5929866.1 hypothetical protein [Providencia rettgeri]